MKRLTFLILSAFLLNHTFAQITQNFHNTPLTEALRTIELSQSDYTIAILSDNLSDLRTSAKVKNLNTPYAVKLVCKDQPVKVKTRDKEITIQYKPKADNRKLWLKGKIYDYVTHLELPHSTVRLLTAEGQPVDSCEAISYMKYGNNPPIEHSDFAFQVPARPANYIIKASYLGFQTTEMPYTVDNIYRREQQRDLPPVYMKRESKMLKEVVVTATKVQFYYKGDTLVFNADAFELAEGSMLDALVRQLPGIELKEGGRIYHNGKYVDALLLNGKDFFRGDHTIMLDNLPAYTVKNIQIYDKWGEQSEFLGQHVMGDNRYVMDVKLKKEYSIGTLGNVEAGAGNEERWLARLFALRFSDHSRLAAYATANNLNGDRKPGENGSWDPQRLQNGGMLTQQQAGIDYNVEDRNSVWKADGSVQVTHTDLDRQAQTNRQNFLPTGDTYDRIQQSQRDKNLALNTNHHFYRNFGMWNLDVRPSFSYEKFDNTNGYSSLTTRNESALNKNLQRGLIDGHQLEVGLRLNSTFKFHHSPDWASVDASVSFNDRKEDIYNRQQVQYGAASGQSGENLNRYTRNHPNRSWRADAKGTYQINFTQLIRLQLIADYAHIDQHRESSVFDIDTIHPLGQLPSSTEYQQALNRGLSYDSHFTEDVCSFSPRLFYNWYQEKRKKIWAQLGFPLALSRQRLDYQRGTVDTTIVRRTIPVNIWDCFIQYTTINPETGRAQKLHLQYIAQTKTSDLVNLVDMRDDADPLNIHLGNHNLHNAVSHQFSFSHAFGNQNSREAQSEYYLHYTIVQNALVMTSQYDSNTGIRTWQADNVNGNYDFGAEYSFNTAIGKKRPLRLHIKPGINYSHSVDLVNSQRSIVNTLALNNNLTLSYKIGEHSLNIKSTTLWQRYTSNREDFTTMHPLTLTNSLSALLKLPWKLEINTDLSLYTRTGYADNTLNTSDLVWNVRLSRPFLKGKLLVMLDGFDLLGQLDNVTRTVNAQGRTETYTNVLPRYGLLHVVYRFNKNPKKK
ncbi:MAG: hypothetical protein IJ901_10040 [Bacteroidaceae bacterium]|nr:hypothetical protein [Bacteroidaceae bacterium]